MADPVIRPALFNGPIEIPPISKNLVLADNICDNIPGLSSISNAINLVLKGFFDEEDLGSAPLTDLTHYKWHIQEKSVLRCVILIILPGIGSLIFAIYDCINKYNNEAFVIAEVSQDDKSDLLKNASLKLRSTPQVIYAAIREIPEPQDPQPLPQRIPAPANPNQIMTVRYPEDREIALRRYASPLLQHGLDFMRSACSVNGKVLKHAPVSVKRDYQAAKNAVISVPWIYRFVDPSLREGDSKEVMELADIALANSSGNIVHAPVVIRNDRERALDAVRRHPHALENLPQYQDDEEFADTAIAQCGDAYKYISLRLKQNRERAMKAIKNGCSLQHIPDFQDDEDVVLYAINLETKSGGLRQIQFASARLKNLDRFVKHAARQFPLGLLNVINPRFSNDRKFIEFMIDCNGLAYNALPENWRLDVDIAITAYTENSMTLKRTPQVVQDDPRFIAAKQRIDANRAERASIV